MLRPRCPSRPQGRPTVAEDCVTTGSHHGGFTGTHPEPLSTSSEKCVRESDHPRGFGTKRPVPQRSTATTPAPTEPASHQLRRADPLRYQTPIQPGVCKRAVSGRGRRRAARLVWPALDRGRRLVLMRDAARRSWYSVLPWLFPLLYGSRTGCGRDPRAGHAPTVASAHHRRRPRPRRPSRARWSVPRRAAAQCGRCALPTCPAQVVRGLARRAAQVLAPLGQDKWEEHIAHIAQRLDVAPTTV